MSIYLEHYAKDEDESMFSFETMWTEGNSKIFKILFLIISLEFFIEWKHIFKMKVNKDFSDRQHFEKNQQ